MLMATSPWIFGVGKLLHQSTNNLNIYRLVSSTCRWPVRETHGETRGETHGETCGETVSPPQRPVTRSRLTQKPQQYNNIVEEGSPEFKIPKYKSAKRKKFPDKEGTDLRNRILSSQEKTSSSHVYAQIFPWESKNLLAEHLKSHEIYNQDGLIVLNKPYGLPLKKLPKGHKSAEKRYESAECPFSMHEILPILQEMYEVKTLAVIKGPERWSSGVLLLASNPSHVLKVRKSFSLAKSFQQPIFKYLAITMDKPIPDRFKDKIGITMEFARENRMVPVIKKSFSKKSVGRQDVKSCVIEQCVLSHNEETKTALVELNVQTIKWHLLRVWLAYCYSPVLGDFLYGNRVSTVMGKRFLISPQNISGYQLPNIPQTIFTKLDLHIHNVEILPCHLHLSSICLPKFKADKSDLNLHAPLPDFFSWTCDQLMLTLETEQESKREQTDDLQKTL